MLSWAGRSTQRRAQFYSVSKKRQGVSTKTERESKNCQTLSCIYALFAFIVSIDDVYLSTVVYIVSSKTESCTVIPSITSRALKLHQRSPPVDSIGRSTTSKVSARLHNQGPESTLIKLDGDRDRGRKWRSARTIIHVYQSFTWHDQIDTNFCQNQSH